MPIHIINSRKAFAIWCLCQIAKDSELPRYVKEVKKKRNLPDFNLYENAISFFQFWCCRRNRFPEDAVL